jgi:carbon monoxide dehydrogenase subunit G
VQAVRSNYLAISLTIDAPIQSVWDALADWEKQGDWMLATKVWVTSSIQEGVGTQISAFTGIKSLGLLDTMEVTSWVPPFVCDVVHTGSIIKGVGKFELHEISPMRTRFDWSEEVLAPRPLFLVIFPGLYVGVRISLGRFARSLR